MNEINDGKIYPRYQMPESGSNTGSITQWISICKCADLQQANSLAADPVVICAKCNKRVEQGRVGIVSGSSAKGLPPDLLPLAGGADK